VLTDIRVRELARKSVFRHGVTQEQGPLR
jgi:hypothetical protein